MPLIKRDSKKRTSKRPIIMGSAGFEPAMGISPSALKVRSLRPLGNDPSVAFYQNVTETLPRIS